VKAWRAGRDAQVGTLSAPKRFDAVATKRTRGWSGMTRRHLR
jgi:hypothetical protein